MVLLTLPITLMLGLATLSLIHFTDCESKDAWVFIRVRKSIRSRVNEYKRRIGASSANAAIAAALQQNKVMPHNQKKELMTIQARNFKAQGGIPILNLIIGIFILFAVAVFAFYFTNLWITYMPAPPNNALSQVPRTLLTDVETTFDNGIVFILLIGGILALIPTYKNPSVFKGIVGVVVFFCLAYFSLFFDLGVALITPIFSANTLMPNFYTLMVSNYLLAFTYLILIVDIVLNFRRVGVKQNGNTE